MSEQDRPFVEPFPLEDQPMTEGLQDWCNRVAANIRKLREKAGMSIEVLAADAALPPEHLRLIEDGKESASNKVIRKIAAVFDVDIWEIDPNPRWAYFGLVRSFPLRHLSSDQELAKAIEVIDSLIARGDLDAGEQDYLDILTDIVERCEADQEPVSPRGPKLVIDLGPRGTLTSEQRARVDHARRMVMPADFLPVIVDALEVVLNQSRDGFDLGKARLILNAILAHCDEVP